MTVDLDAARRARAERLGNPKAVVDGREYALRPDLSFAAVSAFRRGMAAELRADQETAAREFVAAILADPADLDAFMATVSWFDVSDLFGGYFPTEAAGESSASSHSSNNGGKRSRPTSKRSTKSTSLRQSTKKR